MVKWVKTIPRSGMDNKPRDNGLDNRPDVRQPDNDRRFHIASSEFQMVAGKNR